MKTVTRKSFAHRGARLQKGATLLEAIAYLGIAAIIIVGAVSLLTRAFSSAAATQTIEQFESIYLNVKKLYSAQANYDGIKNSVVFSAGGFPSTLRMSSDGSSILNAWSGTVTVSTGSKDITKFSVSFANVPKAECIEVVSSLTANHWGGATVGGSTLETIPVTPVDAAKACDSPPNTITLTSLN